MDEIRDKHQRYVAEEGGDKNNIHALIWYIYVIEKEYLIKRYFLVSFSHLKGVNIDWTCVKDHIIDDKYQCEAIGLHGFDYKLFE